MEQEKRAVCSKGLLPTSLGELCSHLGVEYTFHGADPDAVIRTVTESEMPSIGAGSLAISPKGVDSCARDAVKNADGPEMRREITFGGVGVALDF